MAREACDFCWEEEATTFACDSDGTCRPACASCAERLEPNRPVIRSSFGDLPTKAVFRKHYKVYVGPFDEENFYLDLKGEDRYAIETSRAASRIYDGPRAYDGEEIWGLVKALDKACYGYDEACSLVSAILGIVGIEWI